MLARTVSITPTSPDVPIPPPDAVDLSLNITVENGPAIMLEITAGYNIDGFLIMFGICNIEVPNPCANNPLHLFSLKLATANPIIWHAQPTHAAPPASNIFDDKFPFATATQIAADDVGMVRRSPIEKDKTIPAENGASPVAMSISFEICLNNSTNGYATNMPIAIYKNMNIGIPINANLNFFDMCCPNSIEIIDTTYAPIGSPIGNLTILVTKSPRIIS